tara:strand:- start:699 stop:1850 length:1152 start_codon:yes stop_codon:yes gene_type:complete
MSAFGAALSTWGAGLFQMGPQMANDRISAIEAQAEEAKQARAEMFKVTAMAMDQYTNQIQISQNQAKIDLLRNEDTRKQANFETSQAAAKAGTWEWKEIENRISTQNQLTGQIESVETQPTYGWQNSTTMEFVPYNPGQTSPDGQVAPVETGGTIDIPESFGSRKEVKDWLRSRLSEEDVVHLDHYVDLGINEGRFKIRGKSTGGEEAGINEPGGPIMPFGIDVSNVEPKQQVETDQTQSVVDPTALPADAISDQLRNQSLNAGLITAPLTGQSPAYGQAEVTGQVMGQPIVTTPEPVVSSVIGAGGVPTQKEVYEYDAEESAAFIDELIAGMRAANIPEQEILEELKKIMTGLANDAAAANSVFADVLARKYVELVVPPSGA